MITRIINGIVISNGKKTDANVYFEDGKITALTKEDLPYDVEIDAKGKYVAPGCIDIHTHGSAGYDFLDGTEEAYFGAAKFQAMHGATTIIPTITSGSKADMKEAVEAFIKVKEMDHDGADMPGLHMEGPYFSPVQSGAQDPEQIRAFDKNEYEELVDTGAILRWSGAPEIDGAKEFAEYLKKKGVLASIGHSDAECELTREMLGYGFSHVTHLYSCTSTVYRKNAYRYAGIIEAAYLEDDMTVEIICDGKHLPKSLLQLVYKLKGKDKTALITDSIRAAGMPEGESVIGSSTNGMKILIEDGVAKLPDRSAFAGSVATCDRVLKTAVNLAEIPIEDAVYMASKTPAKIMNLKNTGDILVGLDADIIIFDDEIEIEKTIVKGRTVYSK